jgi:diguanylate cyclase (GGDEF)-like protein
MSAVTGAADTGPTENRRSGGTVTAERLNRRVVHEGWGRSAHMSRYLALLFAAGGVMGHLTLMLPHSEQIDTVGIRLASSAAFPVAATLLVWGKRMSQWMIHVLLGTGVIVITLGIEYAGNTVQTSITAIFYIWAVLFAFTFFTSLHAWPHVAFIALAYGIVLMRFGNRDGIAQWFTVVGTVAITGYVVGRLAEHNTRLAVTDPLTGLPNRRSFDQMLALELERARRDRHALCVGVLDLDGFKSVNDTLGHGCGDELLRICAARITQCVRGDDVVARLGGDEFALLLLGPGARRPQVVAQRVVEVLRQPVDLGGRSVTISASIGFAVSDGESSPAELLRNADLAMYVAKASPLASYEVYDDEMHDRALERLELEVDLRDAVATDGITVAYQPIVSMDTGAVTGVEVLARWEHPRRGSIPPERFIPIAERTGVIGRVGEKVFTEACRIARRLQPIRPGLTTTVNLSPVQLADPALASTFAEIVRREGVDPSMLVLEVTESGLMQDVAVAAERLQDLKRIGVRVAVDDFGVGHSSLSYLRNFPVDVLKLDKSFIEGLADGGATLARAVIQLGRMLGLDVIAEGVESREQLNELLVLGCRSGQGYLFARPMSEAQLMDHIALQMEHAPPFAESVDERA